MLTTKTRLVARLAIRRVARFALTLFIFALRLVNRIGAARLVITLFVIGCLWVMVGAAFLWSIPVTVTGLVLCVPAVIVASLPKGNTP